MAYEVQTSVFEGPFDLLLHLILKQEVDLWEISLSVIVDAYLSELERMDHLDLDVATEFLLIAATLVELKARRLLPGVDEVELDEELLRFEERDLLLARLLECKTFKDASKVLERRRRVRSRPPRIRSCRPTTSHRYAPACATRSSRSSPSFPTRVP
jgi:segregation and condensation protein A